MKTEEKDTIPEDYFDEISGVIVNPSLPTGKSVSLPDKVNGTKRHLTGVT